VPQTNVIIKICPILLFTLYNTKNIAYHIVQGRWHVMFTYLRALIFCADKLMVMGSSKNSLVFNFEILLKLRKFDAREINMFYSI